MFKSFEMPKDPHFSDDNHFVQGQKGNNIEVLFKRGSGFFVSWKWLKKYFPHWNKVYTIDFTGEVRESKISLNKFGYKEYVDVYQWLENYQVTDELNTFQLKLLYSLNWFTYQLKHVHYNVCAMLMAKCPNRYFFTNVEYPNYDEYIKAKRHSLKAPVEIPEIEEEKTEEVLISYTPRKNSPKIPSSNEKVSQDQKTIADLNKLFWKDV